MKNKPSVSKNKNKKLCKGRKMVPAKKIELRNFEYVTLNN